MKTKTKWISGLTAIILVMLLVIYSLENYLTPSIKPFSGTPSRQVPVFVDRTVDFGITAPHRQGDEHLTSLDETAGSGACALDFDNDGWMDLFVVNGTGETRYYGRRHWWQGPGGHHLLRNQHGERFVDVTKQAGINITSHGMGCVAADFDNDGYTDIFITNIGSDILLHNNGDGTFTNVTKTSGLGGDGWHTAAAVADVDGDGKLDLYVGSFIDFDKTAHTFEPGSQFKPDVSPFFNSALYPAESNHLYRNLGGMRFQDVTKKAGVGDAGGRTISSLWSDFNHDGKPDLLVVNAFGTSSTTIFMNKGNWNFEPLGDQARIQSGLSYHGAALGDLNNDGQNELILTASTGERTSIFFQKNTPYGPVFSDDARQWHVAMEKYSAFTPWTPILADFNNDGWTDLFIDNGRLTPDPDTAHVTVGQPKILWLNTGGDDLHQVKQSPMSPLLDRQSGRGMVTADFNNDGLMDLYVVHNNDLGQLLINQFPGHNSWIGVRVSNKDGNTDSVGTRVTVTTEQGTQTKWFVKGMGFLSDSTPRLHFGLGTAKTVKMLAVMWPDGTTKTFQDLPVDAYFRISQKSGLTEKKYPILTINEHESALITNEPPEIRASYYQGLSEVDDNQNLDSALKKVLLDPSDEVRLAVVKTLNAEHNKESLNLLLRFLEDKNAQVAAMAVDGVCSYKEESAVRYLLRMFSYPASLVRIHTAECFKSYFEGVHDIQAVIYRKHLALPYLIAQLSDSDINVQVAAEQALGESESFRGVPPLIEKLSNKNEVIRNQAIRALGLIRDRYALAAIKKLMEESQLSSTAYTQIFIALRRMNYENLNKDFKLFALGRGMFAKVTAMSRLETLYALLVTSEGVVFPRDKIMRFVNMVYRKSRHSKNNSILYARIATASHTTFVFGNLRKMLNSSDERVRASAYAALFIIDAKRRLFYTGQALRDRSDLVRENVLTQIRDAKFRLNDEEILPCLSRSQTRLAAINAIIRPKSSNVIRALKRIVFDSAINTKERLAAINALSRSDIKLHWPNSWYKSVDTSLLVASFDNQIKQLPEIYVSRSAPKFVAKYLASKSSMAHRAVYDFLLNRDEFWAKKIISTALQSSSKSSIRKYLIEKIGPSYFPNGGPILAIAIKKDDHLRFVALRKLNQIHSPMVVAALQKIEQDKKENLKIRILASSALPPSDEKKTLIASLSQSK